MMELADMRDLGSRGRPSGFKSPCPHHQKRLFCRLAKEAFLHDVSRCTEHDVSFGSDGHSMRDVCLRHVSGRHHSAAERSGSTMPQGIRSLAPTAQASLPGFFCLPAKVDNVSGAGLRTGPENALFFRKRSSALAKPPEMQYNSETQKNRCKCVSPERSVKACIIFSITPS